MLLPQRPYLPVGTLLAAVSYPALPDRFGAGAVAAALTAVGLDKLAPRLGEEALSALPLLVEAMDEPFAVSSALALQPPSHLKR